MMSCLGEAAPAGHLQPASAPHPKPEAQAIGSQAVDQGWGHRKRDVDVNARLTGLELADVGRL